MSIPVLPLAPCLGGLVYFERPLHHAESNAVERIREGEAPAERDGDLARAGGRPVQDRSAEPRTPEIM